MGMLEGVRVVRSSDPAVRQAACVIDDFYVDVPFDVLHHARDPVVPFGTAPYAGRKPAARFEHTHHLVRRQLHVWKEHEAEAATDRVPLFHPGENLFQDAC